MNEEQDNKNNSRDIIGDVSKNLLNNNHLALKIKLIAAGIGVAFIVSLLIIIVLYSLFKPIIEVMLKNDSENISELDEEEKKFRDKVNNVYDWALEKYGVQINRPLLVSTVLYGGDYSQIYNSDSVDIDLEENTEETDNSADSEYDESERYSISIRELKKLAKMMISKEEPYALDDGEKEETRKESRYYNHLKDKYVPSEYDEYIGEKNREANIENIIEDIYELSSMYKYYFEEKESNNVCYVGGNLQASQFLNMTTEQYISVMGPIAQADYSRTGIFASVTLAQSIIESGWGKSGLSVKNNNMFGMKCSSDWPKDKCTNWSTNEDTSGCTITIVAGFKKYDSVEESVYDHSRLLTTASRYKAALSASNYREQIQAIKDGGYATDRNYVSTIVNTIERYDLDKWDVKMNVSDSNLICTDTPTGLNGWSIRTIAPTKKDPAFVFSNWSNVGQCVWYARARAIEIVTDLEKNGKIDSARANLLRSKLNTSYGNGGDIYDRTRGVFKGSSNLKEPKPGSYIVWKEPGSYGHVAIVEDVNQSKNTITITEGWASSGSSCPSSWSCVRFSHKEIGLDDFYSGYGKHYIGGYKFSGYVYFLELEGE